MSTEMGTPLVEFAEGRKQPELAALLGVTQSAVSQMINSKRNIRVRVEPDGSYYVFEIRPIGRWRAAA